MKISILGCGRWGSFLGWYLDSLGHDVIQWGLEDEYTYRVLKDTGKNEYVDLSPTITLTSDLKYAVSTSSILIISISSQNLDGFLKTVTPLDIKEKKFVLCMKGIENETGRRLSQILIDNGIDKNKIAIWVGPGHIQDFVAKIPNCMVIDSYDPELKKFLVEQFKSDLIRFYYGNDIIGNEIGAAAKNVIGIAAGMLDGLNLFTLKGPLMARGAREVSRLIEAMGGNPLSAFSLAHLGDYETTLFSLHSNNRRFGEMYAKGEKFEKLAEGVFTSKAMMFLSKKYNVELPITNAVYSILFENEKVEEQLVKLFNRKITFE